MSSYSYDLEMIEDNIKSIIEEFRTLLPNSTELLDKLTKEVNKLEAVRNEMNEDEYNDYECQEHLYHLYEIKDNSELLLQDALTSPFWKRVDTRHENGTWSFRFECDRFTVEAPSEYDALNDKRFTHAVENKL